MFSFLHRITNKQNRVVVLLVLWSMMGVAAVRQPKDGHLNLKVLPKDISDQKLDKLMLEDFEHALGVTCAYCHEEDKITKKLDYASDARPEKETAREMMRMTLELNKTYFKLNNPALGDSTLVVTCYTCHRENPVPKAKIL